MKKLVICTVLLLAFLFLFGCTQPRVAPVSKPDSNDETVPKTDIKSEATREEPPTAESIHTQQDFFEVYDATPNNKPVYGEFDLKGNQLTWIDETTGWPTLFIKNLESGETRSVTFEGNEIENPRIVDKGIVFERRYSPNNETRIHFWNPKTNEVEFVTCSRWEEPFKDEIIATGGNLVYFKGSATHLIEAPSGAECNLYRTVTVKEPDGTENEISARYVAYRNDMPVGIVTDQSPPPEMVSICLIDTGNDCPGSNCHLTPCDTSGRSLRYLDNVKIIPKYNIFLYSTENICITYDFGSYPEIESEEELRKAVKSVGSHCDWATKEYGFSIEFNKETKEFDRKQMLLDDFPDMPQYGITAFHKNKINSQEPDKKLLKEIPHLYYFTYDNCLRTKETYYTNPSCIEWNRYTKIYQPKTDQTFTTYQGHFECDDPYGCDARSEIIQGGKQTEKGDVDHSADTILFGSNFKILEDKDKKVITTEDLIATQNADNSHIMILKMIN